MADRRSPGGGGNASVSDRSKLVMQQTGFNDDIEKQNTLFDPKDVNARRPWEPDFAGQKHKLSGLYNEYGQTRIRQEDALESPIQKPGLMQRGVPVTASNLPGEPQAVQPQASNFVSVLRDKFGRLSVQSDGRHVKHPLGDIHIAKRSMEDVIQRDGNIHEPAPKHRKTTREFSTASQPVAEEARVPKHTRPKASGPRMTALAQSSNPNLKLSSGKQGLLQQQKSWQHKLLSARKYGQSFSDPIQGQQADNDTNSSTVDSRQASRRNSDTSDVMSGTPHTSILLQPDSKPMPENQLAAEIKALYSGLVMIESKCISVDHTESVRLKEIRASKNSNPTNTNKDNNWPAITSLHRALLNEHHDFFLASQHPAASEPLKQLARTYSMPERMWKHGIRSPLELFRFGLPQSKEYMIAFIIISYQMIGLLYETVSSFEDTWAECLGDLARYRMAIEDEDLKDREIWSNVSRSWYSKASVRQPRIGRLYHHQAILARTNPLKQTCFYARALNATQPFVNARESILTLFNPILSRLNLSGSNRMTFDSHFIRLQAMIFTSRELDTHFDETLKQFLSGFSGMIDEAGDAFKSQGELMAHVLIADLFRWGSQNDSLRKLFIKDAGQPKKLAADRFANPVNSRSRLKREWGLTAGVLQVILKRWNDENVLPFLLIFTAFLTAMVVCGGVDHIDTGVPIDVLATCGNHFQMELENRKQGLTEQSELFEPIVLDTMYGQIWAEDVIPKHTSPRNMDHEDPAPFVEYPPAIEQKRTIVMFLQKMASTEPADRTELKQWISFDKSTYRFDTQQYPPINSPTKVQSTRGLENLAIVGPDTPYS